MSNLITSFYFNLFARQFIKSHYLLSLTREASLFHITRRTAFFNNTPVNYLCASVLFSSLFTFHVSATKLTVADNLLVRDIDDKAVEHGFFSSKQTMQLSQGKHVLVVKYKDVFEDLDFAEERLVQSDYFVVKFTVDKQLTLVLSTNNIADLAAAERFVKTPELILVDEDKEEVVLALEKLTDYELTKKVNQVITTLSLPVVSTQGGNTAIKLDTIEYDFNKKVLNQVDAVPMLKYWWQKASRDEKEQFIDFIDETKP
ncbi:uncharacterized protein family UPF0319 [Colwellia marinimaniae]|uniref:Uncharacterized protein family UPF0319 n=1 Tax=Colwellia marinimaniae TaxID=1513592 RepID=A0ABQ0MV16_9GAMM|nr:uncharacterized protein family UPF0319 [Colwellia marinimaniae]